MSDLNSMNKLAVQFGGLIKCDMKCPKCGKPLYQWELPNKFGKQRCGPTCVDKQCGYRELIRRNQKLDDQRGAEARRKDAITKMANSSLITDSNVWKYTFDNYKPLDTETARAKGKAKQWAKQIVEGSKLHAVLTGRPGAGKTHLGMAMIDAVMVDSNFKVTCAVISYRELLEQLKFAMNDVETRKAITGSLMAEIKKTDFVVVDDLGAELGRVEDQNVATSYDVDVLTSLTEARLHKATVYTTNLNSKQIRNAYGERVFSRILNGSKEADETNSVVFKETQDKRQNPQLLNQEGS